MDAGLSTRAHARTQRRTRARKDARMHAQTHIHAHAHTHAHTRSVRHTSGEVGGIGCGIPAPACALIVFRKYSNGKSIEIQSKLVTGNYRSVLFLRRIPGMSVIHAGSVQCSSGRCRFRRNTFVAFWRVSRCGCLKAATARIELHSGGAGERTPRLRPTCRRPRSLGPVWLGPPCLVI